MDASWKDSARVLLLLAPLLAGCTQSPETVFEWDVNDHLSARHVANNDYSRDAYARNDVTRGSLPKLYVVQGQSYSVPAPKPRPDYQSAPSYRSPAYAPDANDLGDAPAFVWPVSGDVISGFGATGNGQRNDGINIATASGTPIHAAAAGTVTYSGNELKDYGNLVLIKHDGGYVTAYAHADKLIVNRGDYVAKGQVIGYAGSTGDVTQPQLHFEIRHDTQPVNPRPLLMARNS